MEEDWLDKLLCNDMSMIPVEQLPQTFEEWVEIHGEPDYVEDNNDDILVIECEQEPIVIDESNLFYEDKGMLKIHYANFTNTFAKINNCVYSNGVFYTPEGVIAEGQMRQDISFSLVDKGWRQRLDVPTNAILTSLKDVTYIPELSAHENIIPFKNGDMYIQKEGRWIFKHNEKRHTPYRLSADFIDTTKPSPLFDKWLYDVFEKEDIPTVQEMLGYALVPTTASQEAFFLVGEGQVGKSVLGVILRALLGNGFYSMQTKELSEGRFEVASIENKLVAYDDDLGEAALTSTGTFKKLITADTPIRAERKYKDAYNFKPYCKVICCANFMLSSLYDDSDGFFRRLHPIMVKRKDPNRRNIQNFGQKIVQEELPQIVMWAIDGLKRLIANDWKITWSDRSKQYMGNIKNDVAHYPEFINDTITIQKDSDISSMELRKLYERWCKENSMTNMSTRRMQNWFSNNAYKYGMEYSRSIVRNDKQVRGYKGVNIKEEWRNDSVSLLIT